MLIIHIGFLKDGITGSVLLMRRPYRMEYRGQKNGIMERMDKGNVIKGRYPFVGSKIYNRVLQNLIVGSYSDPPAQACFL